MKLRLLVSLAVMALAACATPRDRTSTDTLLWTSLNATVNGLEATGKLTGPAAKAADANIAQGWVNLAAASTWLAANPALADNAADKSDPPSISNQNALRDAIVQTLGALYPVPTPGVTVVTPAASATLPAK